MGLSSLMSIKLMSCDAPEFYQLTIQDPASSALEGMIYFHNYLLFFLIAIGVTVFWFLYEIIVRFSKVENSSAQIFTHSNLLEIFWTIFPSIILLLIAIPSFSLLYSLDDLINPSLTLKIIGHQWFWSYEYSDPFLVDSNTYKNGIFFDSYIKTTSDLTAGMFRLLETDNRIILPILLHIRLLITSSDVLHSWAVPSFGIKVDACPGRLSEASLFIKREGVFFGQCSEICGVNHAFMPIVVQSISKNNFLNWRISKIDLFSNIKLTEEFLTNKHIVAYSLTEKLKH